MAPAGEVESTRDRSGGLALTKRPFQRRFLRGATAPGIDTAVLSIPRGNGKSTLAAHILARVLTPGDPLHRPGTESALCAASLKQARIVYRFLRAELEPLGGYRFADSANRVRVLHVASRTAVEAIGSNGKTAFGMVGVPWCVCDEPGAWEVAGGELLHDAIETAKGKPGSPLRAVYIGTLAPARLGWWRSLVGAGSHGSTYVQALQGDARTWDKWGTIRRANPLVEVSAPFRRKLIEERNAARKDSRLKARFLSYRLNLPSADESTMLLTVDDWARVVAREVPERSGRPIVGVDLGGGRAWSAAVALWCNGRCEALALAPGVPPLEDQERRDRVAGGTYRALSAAGSLLVAPGRRVPPPELLVRAITEAWGRPELITCDRFRLSELLDVVGLVPLVSRVTRWSEAAADVRALRAMAQDGPLAVAPGSRLLLAASLSVAEVKNDDQGSFRLVKRGHNNEARDDVAAALLLAAGARSRAPMRPRWRYHGAA